MLKRALILLVLALAQTGCSIEEGGGLYNPVSLTDESRQRLERHKRELLGIEDIKLGDGPLAAWGRRISADIDVRYTDGTVAYRGPTFIYLGFDGSGFLHNATTGNAGLSPGQSGIWLGLNGMGVGGKRKFTIDPNLVVDGILIQGSKSQERIGIRKEKLIVEATLTASCVPVLLRALHVNVGYVLEREIRCRDANEPQRTPTDPIWRLY